MPDLMFMSRPVVGVTYPVGERSYEVLSEESYTRQRDGVESELLTWRTSCMDCGDRFEFKTGPAYGTMHTRCVPCRRTADQGAREKAQREHVCARTVDPKTLWLAVRKCQGASPKPMSLAKNTSRRSLYAPALLRNSASDLLGAFTHAEIAEGISEAVRLRWLGWEQVGRYKSGNGRKGLFARDERVLKQIGVWVEDQPAPNVFS